MSHEVEDEDLRVNVKVLVHVLKGVDNFCEFLEILGSLQATLKHKGSDMILNTVESIPEHPPIDLYRVDVVEVLGDLLVDLYRSTLSIYRKILVLVILYYLKRRKYGGRDHVIIAHVIESAEIAELYSLETHRISSVLYDLFIVVLHDFN